MIRFSSFILIFFIACSSPEKTENKSEEPTHFVEIHNDYAKGFKILQYPDYKVFKVFDLNQGFSEIHRFQVGGEAKEKHHFEAYPKTVACNSTTQTSYLAKLDLANQLIATSWPELIMNQDVKKQIEKGECQSLGANGEIDLEIALSLDPDILMVYPYENLSFERYEQAGLDLVYTTTYQEEHPLAKAEWIRFFGHLFGEEEKADSIFKTIEGDYTLYQGTASFFSEKPKVFTGSFLNGQWYAPGANSSAVQSIKDAGAEYVFEDIGQKGNVQLDFEVMLEKCAEADFYGKLVSDILEVQNIEQQEERLSHLKSIQEGGVFYCNTSESDYFGDALLEPHEILADLISIFHPEVKREEFKYFKPISIEN
ncbi:MAG: ABC transporter substrate-binding protein [Bacteroidota bacterium]